MGSQILMLPGNGFLSQVPYPAPFSEVQNSRSNLLIDVEMAGIALNDPGAGLQYQLWTLRYEAPDVIVSAPEAPDSVLFSRNGITELALAFDQNMRPFAAFVQDGKARFWWYDTRAGKQVFTDLPNDAKTPKACMDDKRYNQRAISDIILAYTRGTGLYYRQQRDFFETERLLADPCGGSLSKIGLNDGLRLQFELRPADY